MSIKNIEGDQRPGEQKPQGRLGGRMTRRELLALVGGGLGSLGIANLLGCAELRKVGINIGGGEQNPTVTPTVIPEAARAAADSTPVPKQEQLTPTAVIAPKPTVTVATTAQAAKAEVTSTVVSTPKVEVTQQQPTNTLTRVPETNTSTPLPTGTPTVAETPTSVPTKIDTVTPYVIEARVNPAERKGNQWILRHPDQDKTEARTLPEGFTPDKDLHFATDIKPLSIFSSPGELQAYKDWEETLNTKRRLGPALSGYNYDYNDFCQVPNPPFTCNVQADMFAWRVFQGQEVRVPGIGELKGGPRRSVVMIVLNLADSVHAWDPEKHGPVFVKRGFTATGRIFNGQKNVDVLERNLSGHWLFRQAFGIPEKSYIGVTDSPDNAQEVLLVTVQRKQWGNNPDGTKRMEFQLIRSELVKVK